MSDATEDWVTHKSGSRLIGSLSQSPSGWLTWGNFKFFKNFAPAKQVSLTWSDKFVENLLETNNKSFAPDLIFHNSNISGPTHSGDIWAADCSLPLSQDCSRVNYGAGRDPVGLIAVQSGLDTTADRTALIAAQLASNSARPRLNLLIPIDCIKDSIRRW